MAPKIFTACIFLLLSFADAQSSEAPSTTPSEISSISTQEQEIFKLSTESSVECPHCNIVEEVSLLVNQQFSR
jgi:hypothetical protein